MTERGKRKVAAWKHTEKDRGWTLRKARAIERSLVHTYDPERCKQGCLAR